jgi:hypothetical protein
MVAAGPENEAHEVDVWVFLRLKKIKIT